MPTSSPSSRSAAAGAREGVVAVDVDDLVDRSSRLSTSGMKPAPMPWILCGPGWPPVRIGDSAGSTAIDLNAGLRCLEHLADAGDRAAGADAGDEDVDLAVGVVPDLLGGGLAVDLRIGRVLELLRHEGVGRLAPTISSALLIAPGMPSVAGRQDELGAEGREQHAPLELMLSGMVTISL